MGRGAAGKTIVVGARGRCPQRAIARTVQVATGPVQRAFIRENVATGFRVHNADHPGFRSLRHSPVGVDRWGGEYGRGGAHTDGIEPFRSMLKRGYQGTFSEVPRDQQGFSRAYMIVKDYVRACRQRSAERRRRRSPARPSSREQAGTPPTGWPTHRDRPAAPRLNHANRQTPIRMAVTRRLRQTADDDRTSALLGDRQDP